MLIPYTEHKEGLILVLRERDFVVGRRIIDIFEEASQMPHRVSEIYSHYSDFNTNTNLVKFVKLFEKYVCILFFSFCTLFRTSRFMIFDAGKN